jgi:hypothetical protein
MGMPIYTMSEYPVMAMLPSDELQTIGTRIPHDSILALNVLPLKKNVIA